MTRLQIRTVIYGAVAGLQTLSLGINEGDMTARDWIQLVISSVLAAAIAVRALYDTAPSEPAPQSVTESTIARLMEAARQRRADDPPPEAKSPTNTVSPASPPVADKPAEGGGSA